MTEPLLHVASTRPGISRSEKWERSFARRTYVEGAFGNITDASNENLRRGFFGTQDVADPPGWGDVAFLTVSVALSADLVEGDPCGL